MIGEALAIFSAFCWAVNGAIYKVGLRYGDILSANFVRVTLTAFGFFLIMFGKGELVGILKETDLRIWILLVASAVFAFFVGDMLYMDAIRRCGVARAVPISSTYPLFVALWTAILFGKIEPNVILGAMLIVLAIHMITEDGGRSQLLGIVFATSAAVFWSFSIMIVKHLTNYLPAEAIAGFRFTIVSAITLPFLAKRGFKINFKCFKWMSSSSAVLVAGNYAFVLALSVSSATKVSTLSSIYPIIAQLFAVIVKEKVTAKIFVGTVLATVGVVLVVCV